MDVPHGVDRKAPTSAGETRQADFQKPPDVVPSLWFGRENRLASAILQVVPQACKKDIFLVPELRIESRLVHPRRPLKVLKRGLREPLFPENRERFR